MCFYDDIYMCICDLDRFSNCFIFDHNTTYNCHGQNDRKCLQDSPTCPVVSMCICSDCFYGTKCQFSTKGFVLSLGYILSYHIKPNVSLFRQPLIVKMSVVVTSLMFVFGLINGFFININILQERNKKCRLWFLFISFFMDISMFNNCINDQILAIGFISNRNSYQLIISYYQLYFTGYIYSCLFNIK
jgi:hypothetical protein